MSDDRRFRPARLAGREDVGGGLARVTVDPEGALLTTYRQAGQYVEMRVDGETGFFVLASDPGASPWELIMRSGGGASDVVLTIQVGSPIELTGALGDGFPVAEVAGRPLVIAINGTGVAAVPPIVHRRIRDGDAGLTHVFLGLRSRDELPLAEELRSWQQSGVDVVVCLSQAQPSAASAAPATCAAASEPGVTGPLRFAPGYVQDVLRARVSPRSLAGGRIFAVGTSAMLEALSTRAREMGLREEHIHTNY